MELWVWTGMTVFLFALTGLVTKIYLIKKSLQEIEIQLTEKLGGGTNTLITVKSHDKDLCRLAASLNTALSSLRCKQLEYEQGNVRLQQSVTNISHDLRTPLTAICGYLELLETEELSPVSFQYISIITERTKALMQLTEELFNYSVSQVPESSGEETECSIGRILEESIAAFYTILNRASIEPVISMPDTPVLRTVSPSALSRVFSNLLHNAVKYSDGDLSITLSPDGTITFINSASSLNEIETGRLFDRFYTVENAKNSTGLGLSIAKTLLARMNGSITAVYENGQLIIRIQL